MTKNDIIELKLKLPYDNIRWFPDKPLKDLKESDWNSIIDLVSTKLAEQLQKHVNQGRFLIEPMIITLNKEDPSELIIRTAIK